MYSCSISQTMRFWSLGDLISALFVQTRSITDSARGCDGSFHRSLQIKLLLWGHRTETFKPHVSIRENSGMEIIRKLMFPFASPNKRGFVREYRSGLWQGCLQEILFQLPAKKLWEECGQWWLFLSVCRNGEISPERCCLILTGPAHIYERFDCAPICVGV